MPDHVRLMLGASPTGDIVTVVGHVKNLAQREAWRRGIKGTFGPSSFWDHCLRGDERLEQVVEYVLNNPVRSGSSSGGATTGFQGRASGGQGPALPDAVAGEGTKTTPSSSVRGRIQTSDG